MERTLAARAGRSSRERACGSPAGCTTSDSWRRSPSCWCAIAAASPRWCSSTRRRAAVARSAAGDGDRGRRHGRVAATRRRRASSSSTRRSASSPSRCRRRRSSCAGPQLNAQLPTLLDHAAVSLRHPPRRAVAAIAAASVAGFRSTLDGLGFTEVFTPKVVAAATESGANVFPIDWFGRRAYLAQSPQFYKQIMVGVFERVYEVGAGVPGRAARHRPAPRRSTCRSTPRSASSPTTATSWPSCAPCSPAWSTTISERARPALDLLGLALPTCPTRSRSSTFREAQEMIERATGAPDRRRAGPRPGRRALARRVGAPRARLRVRVRHRLPDGEATLLHPPRPDDPAASNSFDLLFRGLELVTGGQRLHRYDDYVRRARRPATSTPFDGYLEAFRHGMPPHGGFAIGLERWVARLTGAANVREVTLFPRDLNRLVP